MITQIKMRKMINKYLISSKECFSKINMDCQKLKNNLKKKLKSKINNKINNPNVTHLKQPNYYNNIKINRM